MVAHLVRLKLQLLRNGLRRSPAALIGIALGLIYGGGLLVLGVAGLVALRFQPDLELTRHHVGSGPPPPGPWCCVLVFGTDPTLDPVRSATFAVPERQLATGLAVAGLVRLPGAATAAGGLDRGDVVPHRAWCARRRLSAVSRRSRPVSC